MKPARLYALLCAGWMAALVWLFFSYNGEAELIACPIKLVWHIPCPACGTTRAIQALMHGDVSGLWHYNPLGLVAVLMLITLPFVLVYDALFRRMLCCRLYEWGERWVVKYKYWFISIVLLNWAWGIYKHL